MMLKTSLGAALVLAVGVVASAVPEGRADLIVHEWGTFTTVAGHDGRAVPWRPLDGASDLPCFVERAALPPKPSFATTVRMETPVIYFHAASPVTVDVDVSFRQGLMTEFFPHATPAGRPSLFETRAMSGLTWKAVSVAPGAKRDFPSEPEPSHYYAARAADATPLQAGSQKEGFLFYRGIGSFELPLTAVVTSALDIDVSNNGPRAIPAVMLFENRAGRIGFRTSTGLKRRLTMPRPVLDASAASARASLVAMLIAEGLYPKEAAAMVETWSDSWFEEGARIFYVVPAALVDDTLPLRITPAPAETTRVFVGRLELATPEILRDLESALIARDWTRLVAHGRFVEPFSRRLLTGKMSAGDRAKIEASVAAVDQVARTRVTSRCASTT